MIETIRIGFFNRGEFTRTPSIDPEALHWAGVWVKVQGKPWQAIWTQIGKGDPLDLVAPGVGIGRHLAKATGANLILPLDPA